MKKIIILCGFVAGLVACNKSETISPQQSNVFRGFEKPAHFPATTYNFATNTITQDGFELGKKLFYDPILSINNTISCASCHIQSSAFTQHGHDVSHGVFDSLGARNSPPIMNLAWMTEFMWDGGIHDLDLQPVAPITSHVEMGETMPGVLQKLNQNDSYKKQFQAVYGTTTIEGRHLLKALSQFMVMCVSASSKYDSVKNNLAVFTPSEQSGYAVFKTNCNQCHTEPLFFDNGFHNNGIAPSLQPDYGRYLITQHNTDKFLFKTPSLRNLAYTAPYMHDGSIRTIDGVIDHYTNGLMYNSPTLDTAFTKHANFRGVVLTAAEKTNLLNFLKTLNDESFIRNKTLSEP